MQVGVVLYGFAKPGEKPIELFGQAADILDEGWESRQQALLKRVLAELQTAIPVVPFNYKMHGGDGYITLTAGQPLTDEEADAARRIFMAALDDLEDERG